LAGQFNGGGVIALLPRAAGMNPSIVTVLAVLGFQTWLAGVAIIDLSKNGWQRV
jgi:hypothetical protein